MEKLGPAFSETNRIQGVVCSETNLISQGSSRLGVFILTFNFKLAEKICFYLSILKRLCISFHNNHCPPSSSPKKISQHHPLRIPQVPPSHLLASATAHSFASVHTFLISFSPFILFFSLFHFVFFFFLNMYVNYPSKYEPKNTELLRKSL